jgi:hypothetical protein
MKRVFYLGLTALLMAVVLAPVGLSLGNVSPNEARAACANGVGSTNGAPDDSKCATGSVVRVDPCVHVALPILSGGEKCSDGKYGFSNSQSSGGAIIGYLKALLKLLSIAVGAVVIMMIVIAGFQYIMSTADPARVKAAKDRLQNAIIALVLFLMMFAILSFIVPGGIL